MRQIQICTAREEILYRFLTSHLEHAMESPFPLTLWLCMYVSMACWNMKSRDFILNLRDESLDYLQMKTMPMKWSDKYVIDTSITMSRLNVIVYRQSNRQKCLDLNWVRNMQFSEKYNEMVTLIDNYKRLFIRLSFVIMNKVSKGIDCYAPNKSRNINRSGKCCAYLVL